ncbi:MAG: metallophosphoesterase family protein [Promethearchaeota archaeon]
MNKNEFLEIGEYNEKTRKIGKKYYTSLQPTFQVIQTKQTAKVAEGKTIRVGISEESSVVDEIWNFYMQFSSQNLPDIESLYKNKIAELKISTLLRLFHNFYLYQVYPVTFPAPIIQKSYRSIKNKQKRYAKLFFVGDTHGSLPDTLKMIKFFTQEIQRGEELGYDVKITFIGDFIDRNKWDIHNLILLMTFNLKYQKNVLLLRGNHEEISICAHYGFGKRVIENFSEILFAQFSFMFKDLPLIAVYHCDQGSIMALHGGIPIKVDEKTGNYEVPQLSKCEFNNRQIWLDDMDPITQQILWNDPIIDYDPEKMDKFFPNRRGIGYTFGMEIFNEFMVNNKVNLMFRGHQVFRAGFHQDFEKRFNTIFSTSDYVNKMIDARFVELNSNDIFKINFRPIADLPD